MPKLHNEKMKLCLVRLEKETLGDYQNHHLYQKTE